MTGHRKRIVEWITSPRAGYCPGLRTVKLCCLTRPWQVLREAFLTVALLASILALERLYRAAEGAGR